MNYYIMIERAEAKGFGLKYCQTKQKPQACALDECSGKHAVHYIRVLQRDNA
jgi:hypothetical protein